jgi:protein-S-isoprenylcysteine O-methyltransferase Ste14
MDQYTALAMGMPQRLNEVLAFGADAPRLPPQGTSRSTRHGQASSSAGVVALLLMLAAVVLVSHHLAASDIAGVWIERMSAIVFVSVGALLLRVASR